MVYDHFSKMAHFVPLSKLPSSKETAELVLLHAFCVHGRSSSDQGPQYPSVFWKEFNGQLERMNQEMETAPHGVPEPILQSQLPLWVGYA